MKNKHRFISAIILLAAVLPVIVWGQNRKAEVIRASLIPKDGFPFSKEWAYPWYISKDDNGHFEHAMGEPIKADDTAHLYFTASCETNIQGVYNFRYCYASMDRDTLKLLFEDGLPAYASSFEVKVYKKNFEVIPHLVYPSQEKATPGKVLDQALTLSVNGYGAGGYISYEFQIAGHEETYYLRGFFNTPMAGRH
ncbi:hypothetical protein [Taibaiella koreensis]|uniref:hypothetical protein n=1 Tax=Taibaiella koreensis TaxID=1268548 RepID=UPI000E59A3E0|nr:hypothetical protein [Taibaiella koreensis]